MSQIRNTNIEHIQSLPSPKDYLEKFPVTPANSDFIANGREEISRILRGDDNRLILFVGPCSLHDTKAGYEYAERLKSLSEQVQDRLLIVMRVYFEKPRTTVGWKGMIYDPHLNGSSDITNGLDMAREFLTKIADLKILTATEFVDPITPQYIADLIAWGAIGARTSESQTHRQMSSGLSTPVGFKNGTGGSVQLAVDAIVAAEASQAFLGVDDNGQASIVLTQGNPNCHLVLRGGSSGPNYDSASVADAVFRLEKSGVCNKLVVDCSHANCYKDHTKQRLAFHDVIDQRKQGNVNIVGLMLESHINEGNQKLNEAEPELLEYGVSITDPCVGWEETVELINHAYESLS